MAGRPDFKITMGLAGGASVITGLESMINLANRVIEVVKKAAQEAQTYRRVISGHTLDVREADIATHGLIDTLELHRQAARVQAANLNITASEFRALSVAAAQYAQRTGVDITQSFEQLTTAVIAAESRGLRRFGLELQRGGTQAQRQRQAIEELTRSFGAQAIAARDLGDRIYRLQNSWGTAWSEMLIAMESRSSAIGRIFDTLTDRIDEFSGGLAEQRREMRLLSEMGSDYVRRQELMERAAAIGFNPATGELAPTAVQGARFRAGQVAEAASRGELDLETITEQVFAGLVSADQEISIRRERDAIRRELDEVNARLAASPGTEEEAREDASMILAARDQRRAEAARGEALAPPSPSGGGRRAAGEEEGLPAAFARQEAFYDDLFELARTDNERRVELLNDQTRSEIDLIEKREQEEAESFDNRTRLFQMMQDIMSRRKEEEHERYMEQLEEERRAQERAAEAQQETIENVEAIGGAMGKMGVLTDKVGSILTEVAGEESRATEVMKGIKGAFLIAENVVLGATETAKAVAAAADQNYAGAVMHGLAAALHFAAAAEAGVKLGSDGSGGGSGGGSSAGAASAARRHYPENRGGNRGRSDEKAGMVVYFNGPITSRRAQDELNELAGDSSRAHG